MRATDLEMAVSARILRDAALSPVKLEANFDRVQVTSREFTGTGFMTEFERSEELRLFAGEVSLRWGRVGARLNASGTEAGFVLYVDDGYLTTVEGYTYGEDWPERIDSFELYELRPGMELGDPS